RGSASDHGLSREAETSRTSKSIPAHRRAGCPLADLMSDVSAFGPATARQGESLKGARAETGVVVLNDAMISEFFESPPTALSDEQITNICSHLDQIARS